MRPTFSTTDARGRARELFDVDGTAIELPADRDRNFLVDAAGGRFVLKVSLAAADEPIEAQIALLERLEGTAVADIVPRAVSSVRGSRVLDVPGPGDETHRIWMVHYLEGRPLATLDTVPDQLLVDLGRRLAELDLALADFDHEACHRPFGWHPFLTPEQRPRLRFVDDRARRQLVETLLDRFETTTLPVLRTCRPGVIHGDANDHNILVSPAGDHPVTVTGLIDFGDLIHAPVVTELAVASAYAMMDRDDPWAVHERLREGFASRRPLSEAERAVLPMSIAARLCVSVLHSAERKRAEPDNDYVTISERPAWDLLERLAPWERTT